MPRAGPPGLTSHSSRSCTLPRHRTGDPRVSTWQALVLRRLCYVAGGAGRGVRPGQLQIAGAVVMGGSELKSDGEADRRKGTGGSSAGDASVLLVTAEACVPLRALPGGFSCLRGSIWLPMRASGMVWSALTEPERLTSARGGRSCLPGERGAHWRHELCTVRAACCWSRLVRLPRVAGCSMVTA